MFVHGGVLPAHIEYGLENINKETREWLLGERQEGQRPPSFLTGSNAIVWARDYSAREQGKCNCERLQEVLGAMPGAKRMVVSGAWARDRDGGGRLGGGVDREGGEGGGGDSGTCWEQYLG